MPCIITLLILHTLSILVLPETYLPLPKYLETPTMLSKDELYYDSAQIVEKVIEIELINNTVAKLKAKSAKAIDDVTTRLD